MAGLIRSLIACVRFDYATYRAYYQSARAKHFELWADLSTDALVTGYRRRDWEEKQAARLAAELEFGHFPGLRWRSG